MFRTTFDVDPDERETFQELARELADWRLGEYLDRSPIGTDEGIVCKVSHTNKRLIPFLPDRRTTGIPTGETVIAVEGTEYVAIFAKIAVNALRRPGNPRNELATILRQWFGPDAGVSGDELPRRVSFDRDRMDARASAQALVRRRSPGSGRAIHASKFRTLAKSGP